MLRMFLLSLCLCMPMTVHGATIELKGGDRISGEIISETGQFITIKPKYSAAIMLPKAQLILPKNTAAALEPKKAEEKWKREGRIAFGLDVNDGNTQSRDMTVDAKQEWESAQDRYTLKFDYDYGEDGGQRTEEDGRLEGQYDYRLDKQRYLLANLSFLRDVFQDIRLRSSAGVGYGYEWFVDKHYELNTEIGLNYVMEDLDVDPSQSYAALRWHVDGEYKLPQPQLTLFGELDGLVSLEDMQDMSARGKTGVRLPVLGGWLAEVAWHMDWENQAAANSESLDSRYLMSVVYEW